ncbi:MAG TPA: OmpH family outer membrane protein [Chitinophagales bacterium]|nr:OmpH family outer membrane protein [Chitinophagales bacterium]
MKNLSLALNAVLFVLVGVLFYLHFNSKPSGLAAPQIIHTNGKSVTVPQIAYIDIDSFQTNYAYFKTGKLALEARQKTMEAELGRSLSAFQTEYNAFVQKAQTMTEEEGMAAQQKLQEKQQKIEERKQTMEAQFMKETQDFNLQLQEKIVEYLKKYNANGAYTYIFPYSRETINILFVNPANDITSVVLKGMNDEYAANKK